MNGFNRKKSYRRYIYSPFTLFILFFMFLVMLKALWGVYSKERLSAEYLQKQQAELDRLTTRKSELANSVEYLKTDQGVESEIRSKFRVVKEGESVAVIVGDEESTSTPVEIEKKGFFSKYFGWLGF
jgi:cell division protein FtsB